MYVRYLSEYRDGLVYICMCLVSGSLLRQSHIICSKSSKRPIIKGKSSLNVSQLHLKERSWVLGKPVKQRPVVKFKWTKLTRNRYNDVKMSAMASQIASLTIVYSSVYSGANQRKYQSPASLAFVRGIHQWPVNSPHKRTIMVKMFPFDEVNMWQESW